MTFLRSRQLRTVPVCKLIIGAPEPMLLSTVCIPAPPASVQAPLPESNLVEWCCGNDCLVP